jgi:ubiquinone/menaquinone biosynthesis C-methylase UbiE
MKGHPVRVKSEEFREWNEKMVRKYDPNAFHHHPNPIVRFIEAKRVKAILKLMRVSKEDRILEVGCGAGNILERTPAGKLFGVDISEFILHKARKKLVKEVYLFQADAQNLPFKNQALEIVICSEVLEHLLDPSESLKEVARVLSNQGTAIISIPNELLINRVKGALIRLGIFDWLFRRQGEYREMPKKMEDEWHLHSLPLHNWLDLFKKSFRVTRLEKVPYLWLPLRYVVSLKKIV